MYTWSVEAAAGTEVWIGAQRARWGVRLDLHTTQAGREYGMHLQAKLVDASARACLAGDQTRFHLLASAGVCLSPRARASQLVHVRHGLARPEERAARRASCPRHCHLGVVALDECQQVWGRAHEHRGRVTWRVLRARSCYRQQSEAARGLLRGAECLMQSRRVLLFRSRSFWPLVSISA